MKKSITIFTTNGDFKYMQEDEAVDLYVDESMNGEVSIYQFYGEYVYDSFQDSGIRYPKRKLVAKFQTHAIVGMFFEGFEFEGDVV